MVTSGEKSVKICQAAFLGLHGIKASRLKRKVLNFGKDISNNHGKHGNHSKIDEDIKNHVWQHIIKFPACESHYSRSKNQHKKYLDASLTIAEMHHIFLSENMDLQHTCSYRLYQNIFNFEFNISFGYPRIDICDTCKKQQAEIKAAELSQDKEKTKSLKIEHKLHVRKADVFYIQTSEVSENAKALGDNCDTAVIAMDFQKNLPLPLTGVSQEYYKRQLWLHNFYIHDNINNCATMYLMLNIMQLKGLMK